MRCPNCGNEVLEGADFCLKCGLAVSAMRSSQPRRRMAIAIGVGAVAVIAVVAIVLFAVKPGSGGGSGQAAPNAMIGTSAVETDGSPAAGAPAAESAAEEAALKRQAANEATAQDFMNAFYGDWSFEDGEMIIADTRVNERCLPYIAEGTDLYAEFADGSCFAMDSKSVFARGAALHPVEIRAVMDDEKTCRVEVSGYGTQNTVTQEMYDAMKDKLWHSYWTLTFDDAGKITSMEHGDESLMEADGEGRSEAAEASGAPASTASASASGSAEPSEAWAGFPRSFVFASGAGAWSTEMTIAEDGTFTGTYHDSNMGEGGNGYDATVYVTNFVGEFTTPVKVSDTEYTMQLKRLEITDEPGETFEDTGGAVLRTVHVTDSVYGLGEPTSVPVGSFTLYLPGESIDVFSDSARLWLFLTHGETGPTDFYALVNSSDPANDLAFRTMDPAR